MPQRQPHQPPPQFFQRAGQEQRVVLPIYELDNRVNKQVRIRRLGPYLAQRKLRFKSRSPGTALLVEQIPVPDLALRSLDLQPAVLQDRLQGLQNIASRFGQPHVEGRDRSRLFAGEVVRVGQPDQGVLAEHRGGPQGGPEFVLKTLSSFNEDLKSKQIDLSKTWDPSFVDNASKQ